MSKKQSKQLIEGARVYLTLNGGPVEINSEWQPVGRLTDESNTIIMVSAERDSGLYGLNVDGAKNVVLKKDHTPDDQSMALFSTKVPITKGERESGEAIYFAEYPFNNLRLLSIDTNGKLTIREIALVSQSGEFFVSTQVVYQTRVYRDGAAGFYCPQFEDRWPQLMELVGVLLNPYHKKLRLRSKCPTVEKVNSKDLPNQVGIVDWYNRAQGLGCVITNRGAARVHWSNLVGMNGRCFLEPGQQVKIGQLDKPKASLRRSTNFRKEAFQVSVLPAN